MNRPRSKRRVHFANWLARIVVFSLVILAITSAVASCMPFDWLRVKLDGFSGDGSADAYTPAIHSKLRLAYLAVCIFNAILASLLFLKRAAVGRQFERALSLASDDIANLCDFAATVRWHNWMALVIAVAILIVMPAVFIDEPVRYDEAHTYLNYASAPMFVTVTKYDAPNNHILHSIAANISLRIFGDSLVALRLPAWLATIGTAIIIWVLAVRISPGSPIGFAATLFASLPTVLESAINARGHILGAFFLLVALLAFELLLKKTHDFWRWLLLVTGVSFALYSVPTTIYGTFALGCWVVLRPGAIDSVRTRQFAILGIFAGGVVAFVFYSPVLITNTLSELRHTIGNSPLSVSATALAMPEYLSSSWRWLFWGTPLIEQIFLLTLICICVMLGRIRTSFPLRIAVCIISICPVMILQHTLPPERIWLIILPVLVLVLMLAIELLFEPSLSKQRQVMFLTSLALLVTTNLFLAIEYDLLHRTERHGTLRNAEAVAVWLHENAAARQPIAVVTPASATIAYHFKRNDWGMDHFQVPGRGLTDDRSALVVTVPNVTGDVYAILNELGMSDKFDVESAKLVEIIQRDDELPTEIWQVKSISK